MIDDDWMEVDMVIDCEVSAVWFDDDDGVLLEMVTDQGSERIAWSRRAAKRLLRDLRDELARLEVDG